MFFLLFSLSLAFAKEPAKPIPFLGPGAEKLNKEDYLKIYKNYIQSSILLGYPFLQEKAPACDLALSNLFRQIGMYQYPVPSEAAQIVRGRGSDKTYAWENYELSGWLVQLVRTKNQALHQVFLINSSSPKANRQLSLFMKKSVLKLERDPITALEKVNGLPVGYPHPFLLPNSQGLQVKVLKFRSEGENCITEDYLDNSWTAGFILNETRCSELQKEIDQVWSGKLETSDFAQKEVERMKALAFDAAKKNGIKEEEAKKQIASAFTEPFTSEVTIIGSSMRSLAQCNLLAMGKVFQEKTKGKGDGKTEDTKSSGAAGSAD